MSFVHDRMIKEYALMLRRITHKERCDMMRNLWNHDPYAFGELRRAIIEVSKEDIGNAQEKNQEKP